MAPSQSGGGKRAEVVMSPLKVSDGYLFIYPSRLQTMELGETKRLVILWEQLMLNYLRVCKSLKGKYMQEKQPESEGGF